MFSITSQLISEGQKNYGHIVLHRSVIDLANGWDHKKEI